MHLTDGLLHRYLDHELDTSQQEQVRAHLAGCEACRELAAGVTQRAGEIRAKFALLSPAQPEASLSPKAARARLKTMITERENTAMFRNNLTRHQRVWAVVGLIALLAVALSFPQVRAAANTFLGLFRVEKVAIVEFDEDSFNERFNNADLFSDYISQDVKQEVIGEYRKGVTVEEASALAGILVRLPTAIVEGEPNISVQSGERVTFTIDLARLRALVNQLGVQDLELPDSLDGQVVTLELGQAVTSYWGDCLRPAGSYGEYEPNRCTHLTQMPSPTISAPPELDLARIGTALLQVLGMDKTDAISFSNSIDWTTTLVVPLPRGNVDYRYVEVDGVQGVLVTSRLYSQGTRNTETSMLWVKDGVTYALSSVGWNPNMFEIVKSLP